MSKQTFKNIVKKATKIRALKYLNSKKGSKSVETIHTELTMEKYLTPNKTISVNEAKSSSKSNAKQ